MRRLPESEYGTNERQSLLGEREEYTIPTNGGSMDRSPSQDEHQVNNNNNGEPKTQHNINQNNIPPFHWDRDAIHFGIRMSVCITAACLFVLLREPGQELHQAVWIVVTVQFVCWFPSLDTASVVEKSLQRLYGTIVGATSGLTCGFVSLAILRQPAASTTKWLVAQQSTFLILCIASYTYVVCWAAIQFRVGPNRTKIISKYNYACILSLLTFYICVLPFYSDETPKWRKAIYRVLNVIVGCILGALLSISILPRSSVGIVRGKMVHQIQLAGEAAQAVLHMAADSFSDTAMVSPGDATTNNNLKQQRKDSTTVREALSMSHRFWRQDNTSHDGVLTDGVALQKYEDAIQGWRTIQTQLTNLRYDPFHMGTPDAVVTTFRDEMTSILARAQRVQTTVVLLDGIVRNDPKHNFGKSEIRLIAETGTLIQQMLAKGPLEQTQVAFDKLTVRLAQIRRAILDLSSVVAASSQEMPARALTKLGVGILGSSSHLSGLASGDVDKFDEDVEEPFINRTLSMEGLQMQDDQEGRGLPKFVHGSRVCALLFLQLVEHLTLRSVRLYQSWQECQTICNACEKRFA